MNYGLYLSSAGVLTNMHRQDVAANNLANVHTDGFKRDMVMYRQRFPEAIEDQVSTDLSHRLLERLGGGVMLDGSRIDLETGSLKQTGRDLDLALDGEGFLVYQTDNNGNPATRISRDGRLALSPDGFLVNASSAHKILDVDGAPIQIDASAGRLNFDETGMIRQGGQELVQLKMVNATPEQIKHVGEGMFEAAPAVLASTAPVPAQIKQGHLEMSNVDPIKELMRLMAASKAVSSNGNLIRYHDLAMNRAANVLGRVA